MLLSVYQALVAYVMCITCVIMYYIIIHIEFLRKFRTLIFPLISNWIYYCFYAPGESRGTSRNRRVRVSPLTPQLLY